MTKCKYDNCWGGREGGGNYNTPFTMFRHVQCSAQAKFYFFANVCWYCVLSTCCLIPAGFLAGLTVTAVTWLTEASTCVTATPSAIAVTLATRWVTAVTFLLSSWAIQTATIRPAICARMTRTVFVTSTEAASVTLALADVLPTSAHLDVQNEINAWFTLCAFTSTVF